MISKRASNAVFVHFCYCFVILSTVLFVFGGVFVSLRLGICGNRSGTYRMISGTKWLHVVFQKACVILHYLSLPTVSGFFPVWYDKELRYGSLFKSFSGFSYLF